jgi:hypothetical protein
MNKKHISLSLPYSYLAGKPISARDTILTDSFGPAQTFLPKQKQVLAAVEISHFGGEAPPDQIVAASQTVLRSGLNLIIHCHLPEEIMGTDIAAVYPWFARVEQELMTSEQKELILNVHALAADDSSVPLQSLLVHTAENLVLVTDRLARTQIPTRIALEINREKGVQDPGTTYENLLEIYHRVSSPLLGLGWDIGHTYSNVLNGHLDQTPPKEFVQNIIHTHIHDLGNHNQTHWPLTVGTIPLNFYLGKLASVGYGGFYTLEIYPERFKDVLDPAEHMLKSIAVLQETQAKAG